eukprot:jgi/Botrbrau1/15121/Bobra.320_1s0005.1
MSLEYHPRSVDSKASSRPMNVPIGQYTRGGRGLSEGIHTSTRVCALSSTLIILFVLNTANSASAWSASGLHAGRPIPSPSHTLWEPLRPKRVTCHGMD